MSQNSKSLNVLRFLTVAGNIIFILWIIRNGINEGFSGSIVEIFSYLSLILLLVLNTFFIFNQRADQKIKTEHA